MIAVPESVRRQFVEAGWFEGRRVSISHAVPAAHPAAIVLAEFVGLTVRPFKTAGEKCAAHQLEFMELEADEEVTGNLSHLVGAPLVGIAEACGGHGQLLMAADGRLFGRSCVHSAFYFEGSSFALAVEGALLGRRARPILLPGQEAVSLYGIRHTAASPELYAL